MARHSTHKLPVALQDQSPQESSGSFLAINSFVLTREDDTLGRKPPIQLEPSIRVTSGFAKRRPMCRNIKTLHNFRPPATEDEIRASSLQFVRKLSGFTRPSKANELAFNRAVDQIAQAAHELLDTLTTNAPPRDREVEASRARIRSQDRFRRSD
jgi:hypothetical protein